MHHADCGAVNVACHFAADEPRDRLHFHCPSSNCHSLRVPGPLRSRSLPLLCRRYPFTSYSVLSLFVCFTMHFLPALLLFTPPAITCSQYFHRWASPFSPFNPFAMTAYNFRYRYIYIYLYQYTVYRYIYIYIHINISINSKSMYIYKYIYIMPFQYIYIYGKRKRHTSVVLCKGKTEVCVFLSRQKVNGNRRLLFQQMCPLCHSLCPLHTSLDTYIANPLAETSRIF
jgi:hypothetical protein